MLIDLQDANVVNCRYDFYQSAEKVTLSIYAKKADKTKSTVQFEDWKVVRLNPSIVLSIFAGEG
jgi:hypothetical protein